MVKESPTFPGRKVFYFYKIANILDQQCIHALIQNEMFLTRRKKKRSIKNTKLYYSGH
jgi:hypothetical protein